MTTIDESTTPLAGTVIALIAAAVIIGTLTIFIIFIVLGLVHIFTEAARAYKRARQRRCPRVTTHVTQFLLY
jgi:hypothetical protein